MTIRSLFNLSSIFLESKSVESRLRDKICPSDSLYLSDALYQRNITIGSLNLPGWYLSKDNQALVIKKNRDKHNISLKVLTKENLRFGLCPYKNSPINCINWLLTTPSIFSTVSYISMCEQFTHRVTSFPGAARFLHTGPL